MHSKTPKHLPQEDPRKADYRWAASAHERPQNCAHPSGKDGVVAGQVTPAPSGKLYRPPGSGSPAYQKAMSMNEDDSACATAYLPRSRMWRFSKQQWQRRCDHKVGDNGGSVLRAFSSSSRVNFIWGYMGPMYASKMHSRQESGDLTKSSSKTLGQLFWDTPHRPVGSARYQP